jgi:hypothetical protein
MSRSVTDETIIKGDLFIGEATYIKGEWVRRRDYEAVQDTNTALREQIKSLYEDAQSLRERLLKMQPPVIDAIVEQRDNLLIAKKVMACHWGPSGVHVVIAP